MSKNNNSRVVSHKEAGNFVILNLSCRHAVKERATWWRGYYNRYGLKAHVRCPQCKGFKP